MEDIFNIIEVGNVSILQKYLYINMNFDINTVREDGHTPLTYAIYNSVDENIIRLLLDNGAKANICNVEDFSVLENGSYSPEILKYLIERGAEIGFTLIGCASHNMLKHAKVICNYDVNLDLQNERGETALSYAAALGYIKLTKYLVERGATIDLADHVNATPLLCSIYYGKGKYINVVEYLLQKGSNPNIKDRNGSNCLLAAVRHRRTKVVRLVLPYIDNPDDIKEAMQFAQENNYRKIIRLLRREMIKRGVY